MDYDQGQESASEDESVDSEAPLSEEGEEGYDDGPGEERYQLDPTLQWDPPDEWVETEENIPPPKTKPPYQRGAGKLPDLPYAGRHTLLVPTGKRYLL